MIPRWIVLSRSRAIGSTRRLLEAAKARGFDARLIDPASCTLHVDGRKTRLLHRGRRVPDPRVVIPRIGRPAAAYGLAVLHHFELSGALAINPSESLSKSLDEMRTLQLLASLGIRVPRTVLGSEVRSIKELVSQVGGVPVLVRLLRGGDRRAVMVCETMPSLEAALEVLLGLGQNVLVQPYVRREGDRDVRALVVGERVVCAVRRIPRAGTLSRTLERGAQFESIGISEVLADTAVRAARAMDLQVAAVDILDEEGGPKVFEVNGSPALVALERATGLDLAGTIVDHAVSCLMRPILGR